MSQFLSRGRLPCRQIDTGTGQFESQRWGWPPVTLARPLRERPRSPGPFCHPWDRRRAEASGASQLPAFLRETDHRMPATMAHH